MLIKKSSIIAAGSLVLALSFSHVANARDYTQGEGDAAEIEKINLALNCLSLDYFLNKTTQLCL